MKKFNFFSVAILTIVLFANCAPDLIVKSIQQNGTPTVNQEDQVELPIKVTVKNQGNKSAGIFKVSTHYTGASGTYAVAFTVPSESDIWYPYTDNPLSQGGEVTFEGKIIFHPSVHGVTVTVKAIADSCSSDEFAPDYCRVKESDESNNESTTISVILP